MDLSIIKKVLLTLKIQTITINNIEYLTILDFSRLSGILYYKLKKYITEGNKHGEYLHSEKIGNTYLIPIHQFFQYSFTDRKGRSYCFSPALDKIYIDSKVGF